MAQLILTHSSQFHRALRTQSSFPLTLRVGRFFLMFSMTFTIGLLSFFYLMKFTEIHTKGYQLRKLEIEHSKLLTAQETKVTDISQVKTLSAIRESSIISGMIPARTPIYLQRDGNIAKLPDFTP